MFSLAEAHSYLLPIVGVFEQTLMSKAYSPDVTEVDRILSATRVYFMLVRALFDPKAQDATRRIARLIRDWSLFSGGSRAVLGVTNLAADVSINQTAGLALAVDWVERWLQYGSVSVELWKAEPNQYGQVTNYWILLKQGDETHAISFARTCMSSCTVSPSINAKPAGTMLRKFESPYALSAIKSYIISPPCNRQSMNAAEDVMNEVAEELAGANWPQLGDHKMNISQPTVDDQAQLAAGDWSMLLFGPKVDCFLPAMDGANFAYEVVHLLGERPRVVTIDGSEQRIGRASGSKEVNGSRFECACDAVLLSVIVLGVEEE